MSSYLRLSGLLGCAALAAACGGGHDVTPTIITGGGIADPGIDGEANVFVVEDTSDEPISGATVIVGDVTGETDETGLFVATGVEGPQQITVIADGFVSVTWVGVNGANATIPLALEDAGAVDVPQATLTGTIDGFLDLAVPSGGAKIGFVTYSANHDDDDPANDITQPGGGGGGLPPNTCFNSQLGSACDWSLITRTGPQAVVAYIGDLNLQTQAVTFDGFAYTTGVTVQDGVDQSGIALTIADANEIVTPDLTLPDPPTGTTEVAALIRVDLGDDGRLVLPQTADFAVPVPVLSLFPGSSYEVVAVANTGVDTDPAQSVVLDRDVASVDGFTSSDFIALPSGLAVEDDTFSSDVHADGTVHIFDIENDLGEQQWGIAFFDGTASVVKPDEISLPSGTLTLRAQVIAADGIDLESFGFDDVMDQVTAVSVDAVDFVN